MRRGDEGFDSGADFLRRTDSLARRFLAARKRVSQSIAKGWGEYPVLEPEILVRAAMAINVPPVRSA
jgi:hypothetical protein